MFIAGLEPRNTGSRVPQPNHWSHVRGKGVAAQIASKAKLNENAVILCFHGNPWEWESFRPVGLFLMFDLRLCSSLR